MFRICKAAVQHMPAGSSIVNTASINSDTPNGVARLFGQEGGHGDFIDGLAQLLADYGIRANSMAPGPIWTPLILATMPPNRLKASVRRRR